MQLLKFVVAALVIAGVIYVNWNDADMHSVDEPFRRVGVWIVTIFGTLFTLLWLSRRLFLWAWFR